MPALSDYVTGTISLTNGSVDFTGTSTGWLLAGFKEGDTIIDITGATEFMGVIATIDANGAGTLTKAWEGPTLVDVAYRMRYQPDGARVSAQARNLIELLGNGNVLALAGLSGSANQVPMFTGPGAMTLVPKTDLVSGVAYDVQVDVLADRDAYDGQAEGFSVLVADVGDGRAAVYAKASATSGDWTDPAYVTGPIGPLPDVTIGTVTTGDPGTDAEVTATPTVDGVELDFTIPAGRGLTPLGDYNPATAYVLDDAVLYNGSTWIALQATTGNAPPTLPTTSNAYWQLLARQGIDGAGTVNGVGAGTGISVDNTDPTAPIVSAPYAVRVDASQSFDAAQKGQGRANIGADLLGGLRNKILNGDFEVFARHVSKSVVIAASSGGYGPDHVFISNTTNQPVTVSRQSHVIGQVAVPGSPRYKLRLAFASAPTSGDVSIIQPVEDVGTLSGLPFTMTAFVTGPSGVESLGASISQVFGTGGSPSAAVPVSGTALNIATIYDATTQKRTLIGTMPSVSGKTRGSNNDDYLSAAWVLTPRQAGNYELSHWSLVEGDARAEMDCFSPRHVSYETIMLERYHEETPVALAQSTGASAITVPVAFRTPKRTSSPTVTYIGGSSSVTISSITSGGCSIVRPFDAVFTGVTASAELI